MENGIDTPKAKSEPEKIPDDVKLKSAQQYKQEGNEEHKNQNYQKAIGKYHRALLHLKGIGQMQVGSLFNGDATRDNQENVIDENMVSEVKEIKAVCYNNLAACILKYEKPNFERVVQYCDLVLEVSPDNQKAIFRKGKAQFSLKDYGKAIETFKTIPDVSGTQQLIEKCKKELDKQEQTMKRNLTGMFDSKQPGKGAAGDT